MAARVNGSVSATDTARTPRKLRVAVHGGRCEHFGICVAEAPQVFELRGDHRLAYDPSPAPESAAAVRQAARLCPMQAITVAQK